MIELDTCLSISKNTSTTVNLFMSLYIFEGIFRPLPAFLDLYVRVLHLLLLLLLHLQHIESVSPNDSLDCTIPFVDCIIMHFRNID